MIKLIKREKKLIRDDFRRTEDKVAIQRHNNLSEMIKMQKEQQEMKSRVSDRLSLIRKR